VVALNCHIFALTFILVNGYMAQAAEYAIWAASYDASTQTRYIPLELILGAEWDGKREIAFPNGTFVQTAWGTRWGGPMEWKHPYTGEKLLIYERTRRAVFQRMAVRKDGDAIGRVYDSRNDRTLYQEAKFPLGYWKQGETRQYEYSCWYGTGEKKGHRMLVATITIEKLDFEYHGVPHSLQTRWILKDRDTGSNLDNRVYIWSPGFSMVSDVERSRSGGR
jgi:hypothetical protein